MANQENASKTLSLLQEIATEIAQEEKELGLSSLLVAASEIAKSSGINSPLKNSTEFFSESLNLDKENHNTLNNSLTSNAIADLLLQDKEQYKEEISNHFKDDVDILLKQMDIKPKKDNSAIDDVTALVDLAKKKKILSPHGKGRNARSSIGVKDGSSYHTKRYLNAHRNDKFNNLNKTTMRSTSAKGNRVDVSNERYQSKTSKVSELLESSDKKPWNDNIRSSFASETQEMLFRNMKQLTSMDPSSQKKEYIKTYVLGSKVEVSIDGLWKTAVVNKVVRDDIYDLLLFHSQEIQKDVPANKIRFKTTDIHKLSRPSSNGPTKIDLKIDPTLRHSTYDDFKNCSFQPQLKSRKSTSTTDDKKEDSKGAFIKRQEEKERLRRDDLERKMKKAEYDAIVDKMICPNCLREKSYDEVIEKKKMCIYETCKNAKNKEYCYRVDWNKVSRKFFDEEHKFVQKVAEKKERLRKEIADEYKYVEKKTFDKHTGVLTIVKQPLLKEHLTIEEEKEFFDRMQEKLMRRSQKLKEIENEVYVKPYPFQPKIIHRKTGDDDHYNSDDNDPVESFLKRYDEDLDYRRSILPEKYLPMRSKDMDDDLAPFKI